MTFSDPFSGAPAVCYTGQAPHRPLSQEYTTKKDPALRAGPSLRIIYFPVWDLI